MNKSMFNQFLKTTTDGDVLMSFCSEFDALGPATEKQRFKIFDFDLCKMRFDLCKMRFDLGKMTWLCVTERCVERRWTSVTLVQNC